MSIERARRIINLQQTDKTGEWEYIWNAAFIQKLTGLDPMESPRKAYVKAAEALDLDFMIPFSDESGRVLFTRPETNQNMDVAVDPEEIYSFDPFNPPTTSYYYSEMGIDPKSGMGEMAEFYQNQWKENQDAAGDAYMVPICDWYTLVHGFTINFGFEASCIASLEDPRRFKDSIESFAMVTMKRLEAYAQTDAELVLCHDDLAMADRTIYSPDWYRECIFPWYREFWNLIRKSGKKLLFYSDGNIDSILDDLVATGIDGMFLDSCADLGKAMGKYGGKKILLGNVDLGKLTSGGAASIAREVDRCVALGGDLPGYILCNSGQFLHDVPLETIEGYFNYVKDARQRPRTSAKEAAARL